MLYDINQNKMVNTRSSMQKSISSTSNTPVSVRRSPRLLAKQFAATKAGKLNVFYQLDRNGKAPALLVTDLQQEQQQRWQRQKQQVLTFFAEINKFYDTNGKEPSLESDDYDEKRMAIYLQHIRSIPSSADVDALVKKHLPWYTAVAVSEPLSLSQTQYKDMFTERTSVYLGSMFIGLAMAVFVALGIVLNQDTLMSRAEELYKLLPKSTNGLTLLTF